MMKRRDQFLPGAWLSVLLALVLVTAGCSTLSEDSPTAPGDTGTATISSTFAEMFIRADEGGTLRMGSNRVYFPPGALSEDTTVSITLDSSSTAYTLIFDLAPDGIQFHKPVDLTLAMGAPGIGVQGGFTIPRIYYYNPSTSEWQSIGGQPNFERRVITTQIEHFSRYGTGKPIIG